MTINVYRLNEVNRMLMSRSTFLSLIIILNLILKCKNELQSQTEKPKILRKIIGGYDCSTEKYPFVVSIRSFPSMRHFCGGSLLRPGWVLTAAHCTTTNNPNYYAVVAGTSEIDKNGIQRRAVRKVFKHGKFSKKTLENDIALLELKKSFDTNSKLIGLIDLPPFVVDTDVQDRCAEGTVIGWGHREPWNPENTSLSYVFNPILQCVTIPVLTDKMCIQIRGLPLKKGIFCAYADGGSKDACQGDSGGPLFCNNTLYGIVSSGYGCGLKRSPGYYTRVDGQIEFIKNVILRKKLPRFALPDGYDKGKYLSSDMSLILIIVLISMSYHHFHFD